MRQSRGLVGGSMLSFNMMSASIGLWTAGRGDNQCGTMTGWMTIDLAGCHFEYDFMYMVFWGLGVSGWDWRRSGRSWCCSGFIMTSSLQVGGSCNTNPYYHRSHHILFKMVSLAGIIQLDSFKLPLTLCPYCTAFLDTAPCLVFGANPPVFSLSAIQMV